MPDREMVFSHGVVLFECFATFFQTFLDLVPMYTCAVFGDVQFKVVGPIANQNAGQRINFQREVDLYPTDHQLLLLPITPECPGR
jgi:hypothetical protein